MPPTATVAAPPELEHVLGRGVEAAKQDRRRERRASRYAAQRTLWRITGKQRFAYCGRFLTSSAGGVAVKVTAPGTTNAAAGFSGLQTCGSVWACPVCSEKVNARRQAEIETVIRQWIAEGNSILFATFTMRHSLSDGLKDLWSAISPSWAKVVGGASWHGGKRTLGDKARFGIEGWLRVIETKDGQNGWHPHIHALLFVEGHHLPDQQVADLRGRLFGRWERALSKRGYSSLEGVGLDIRRVTEDEALASYFAKNTYGAAAYEVTGSQSKQLGKGGVTPFQLLERIVARESDLERLDDGTMVNKVTGELLEANHQANHTRDLARWAEWEEASAGRRQITWSLGFRDRFDLEPEQTDEEIAEESDLDGQEVVVLTRDEWKAGAWAYKRAQLLDAAERGQLVALVSSWRQDAADLGLLTDDRCDVSDDRQLVGVNTS